MLRDRLVASLGVLTAIAAMAAAASTLGNPALLVAPIAASAVLIFVIPASPLAQPWPVIGGSIVSTLVGIGVADLVPVSWLAAGVAVASAIVAMSLLRCLHPPSGALALLGVLPGGHTGFAHALYPVGADALVLVALGWLFHRVSGHAYPHRAVAPVDAAARLEIADVDAAIAESGETFDIEREDLLALLESATRHAAERQR